MAREQVPPQGNHFVAVLQALFVTLLWSSSWVLIKQGLGEIPPLTFAGLRYTLAATVLWAALLAGPARRAAVAALGARA
ncbi:MAG: EamA family transporter [Trueperaceae bacterium]|nr:EamA family transporter [Trueperaceae bacterium]MCW5820740.1 EamA family transporter [Trueperaceae bacterium]